MADTKERPRLNSRDTYTGIQNNCSALVNDKRIAVEFGDLWNIVNQSTYAQQPIFQGADIKHWSATKAIEQRISLETSNHLGSIYFRERRQTYRDIAQELNLRSSGAASHDRTELRIMNHADQHLHSGFDHWLHYKAGRSLSLR